MIVIPASLRSDFIHMAGMTIHIALESTIHIVGIRTAEAARPLTANDVPVGVPVEARSAIPSRVLIVQFAGAVSAV